MLEIVPGIGMSAKSQAEIIEKINLVAPYVSWVSLDIADGTLVPTKNVNSADELAEIIKKFPQLSFEAHIMVSNPERLVRSYAQAGFKRLVAQVECEDPRLFLSEAEYESVEVGLALDGPSEFEIIEPFLEKIDTVLIMTIEAGASGRDFLPETVEKIRLVHENFPDLPIEVDGGINNTTAKLVREAGASRAAVTSYLFNNPGEIADKIRELEDIE